MEFFHEEYQQILEILGREPNLTELGIFSVMWRRNIVPTKIRENFFVYSRLRKKIRTPLARCLKAGEENAGVIDVGDGWGVAFKRISQPPSAIEPFEECGHRSGRHRA